MTAPTADLLDPTSSAYKKARKRHIKTIKNRRENVEADWTPFRAAEKKYKARFPPPDLSHVLDLALADGSRAKEIEMGWWKGRVDAVDVKEIPLKHASGRPGYVFPDLPGLVLLPRFVTDDTQRELVRWALHDHARPPNVNNLDTHYVLPPEGLWNSYISSPDLVIHPVASSSGRSHEIVVAEPAGPRTLISNPPASPASFSSLASEPKPLAAPSTTVLPLSTSALLPKLRWANIGWFYHWGTKQYDFTRGKEPVDPRVRQVCQNAVSAVPWEVVFESDEAEGWGEDEPDWKRWDETYEPDAGIVNFYQTKDTLMAHVDRSEVCATSPLVSISLGNAAVFLIGGLTRDVPPVPILLRSGDVVIMSGPACRRAYHGVPRILENTLPSHLHVTSSDEDWTPYAEYLKSARINVNVRQVFPKGFEPHLENH
ncbi:hypothetical protein K488DRAFT_51500 [Vararia minispora EC-137]|uniref:Uncharacterized protein n=1 Tax=Vararia minispora EC-137 TaxID=1314806 RepID=A0ACB8QK38_9AGAM|nr:hypothetical protein K488DRAFT_51500 [Vararia minispora EC-137]